MLKKSLPDLPETAGVYLFKKDANVIYVGKAINLKSRVKSYFDLHLLEKTEKMVNKATNLDFIKVDSELEALLLEAKLIKKYMPDYNIISKDDKHPLYITITKDKFPRVITTRKDGTYGPFPSTKNVYLILKMIRKIFPYSDHKLGERACIYNHIGLCSPCPNISTDNKTYLKNIRNIKLILDGKIKKLKKTLTNEMIILSKLQKYEDAKSVKEKIDTLDYITQPRIQPFEYLKNPNLYEDNRKNEIESFLKILKSYFINLKSIRRIECFDIAHLQGVSATASMVVFIDGEADKNEYKHFKIKQKKGQSDFDSMEEVAKRRSNHFESWGVPDLIIVDGSIGQINKFKLNIKNIPIVGIAKNPDRLIINADNKIRLQDLPLQLVSRIRDEAHRFARRYHKKLLLSRENFV